MPQCSITEDDIDFDRHPRRIFFHSQNFWRLQFPDSPWEESLRSAFNPQWQRHLLWIKIKIPKMNAGERRPSRSILGGYHNSRRLETGREHNAGR